MAPQEMVNVFRSADEDAEDKAREIHELLTARGLDSVLLDDTSPEVPEGAWVVRTAAADAASAEQCIRETDLNDSELGDVSDSESLDVETVFRTESSLTAEVEALSVKSVLESAGIATVLIGDTRLPNLGFEVQVARDKAADARELIARAQALGEEAAAEEERATENPLNL